MNNRKIKIKIPCEIVLTCKHKSQIGDYVYNKFNTNIANNLWLNGYYTHIIDMKFFINAGVNGFCAYIEYAYFEDEEYKELTQRLKIGL